MKWLTNIGPREENQDRYVARLNADCSWLIAVADGLGGHPRGDEAAESAVDKMPDRIASPDAMQAAFFVAHNRVAALVPSAFEPTRTNLRACPAATLCVAGCTATGGLIVGYAGDTLPVLLWRDQGDWFGDSLGSPHRSSGMIGYLTRYLGAPGRGKFDLITGSGLPQPPYAVTVVSDGIWEPLVSEAYTGAVLPPGPIAGAVAATLAADDTDADGIAHRIMTTARAAGLDDSATVAVAAVEPAL